MKKLLSIIPLLALTMIAGGQTDLSYYLPNNIIYNPDIPVPAKIIGHEVGEWHVTHDNLINYMIELAALSDRAIWQEYGRSHEVRPMGELIVSSPQNMRNLEKIRLNHIRIKDPSQSASLDIANMPIIIRLGYGIHGNESSAQNSALLAAYHLVAGTGQDIDEILANTVFLIDPNMNPDGYHRHSTWVNMHRSADPVADPNSRELNEPWPGGRTNHYWFDMNRDYLMLQHPESTGKIASYHRWLPTVYIDFHEMGASSTLFWQPGDPDRNNPLVPQKNYDLTGEIGTYYANSVNQIGSLYFQEEQFDDFYVGKGSSYPDIHGSIGILIEQAGTKSHLREVSSGLLSFPFAIRNQFTIALGTIDAGRNMREKLLTFQLDFFKTALTEAATHPVKSYIFSEPDDKSKLSIFIDHLLQHQIEVYQTQRDIIVDGITFKASESYIISMVQPGFRFIRSLFEPMTEYKVDRFYDVSTWNVAMSFNIPFGAITNTEESTALRGRAVTVPPLTSGTLTGGSETYAYLFEMNEFHTPALLYRLLEAGLTTRVAKQPFTVDDGNLKRDFPNGTIMVHAFDQPMSSDELHDFMKEMAESYKVDIFGTTTGLTPTKGTDLGSSSMVLLRKPSIALMVESGISSRDAGEIWHLLDKKFDIPVTLVAAERFNFINPERYNVIIIAGSPGLNSSGIESLRRWNRSGGVIIGYKGGNSWLARNDFISIETVPGARSPQPEVPVYGDRPSSPHGIPGTIFNTTIDLTHPFCYGYTRTTLPVFKNGTMAVVPGSDIYNTPVRYTEKPRLSGYASDENIERIAGTAFAEAHTSGGRIVSIYDNTNFRGIWYGTTRLFMNGIFFGHIIR